MWVMRDHYILLFPIRLGGRGCGTVCLFPLAAWVETIPHVYGIISTNVCQGDELERM